MALQRVVLAVMGQSCGKFAQPTQIGARLRSIAFAVRYADFAGWNALQPWVAYCECSRGHDPLSQDSRKRRRIRCGLCVSLIMNTLARELQPRANRSYRPPSARMLKLEPKWRSQHAR